MGTDYDIGSLVLIWAGIQGVIRYIRDKQAVQHANAQYIWATLCAVGAAFLLYPFNMTLMFVAYLVLALAVLTLWEARLGSMTLNTTLPSHWSRLLVYRRTNFGSCRRLLRRLGLYRRRNQYAKALTQQDIAKASANLVNAVNWNGQSDVYYSRRVSSGAWSFESRIK